MASSLFAPPAFPHSQANRWTLLYNGENYRLIDDCPNRNSSYQQYYEFGSFGNFRGIGRVAIGTQTYVIAGSDCPAGQYTHTSELDLTSSIFDAPSMTPYEPFYFSFLFVLSIIIFYGAIKIFTHHRLF